MFKTQIFLFSVVLLFAAAVTLFPFFHLDENDYHLFTKLLASSKPPSHSPSTSYAEQERHKVCKQLWFQEEGEALLCSLFSEKSALFFFYDDNKIEAIEEMSDTKCVIQEELFYLLPDGREAVKVSEGRLRLRHADPLLPDSWIDPNISDLTRISHQNSDNSHTLSPHLVPQQGGAVLREHCPRPAVSQPAATGERFIQSSGEKCGLTPMQYVFYFEAEKAHYHYNSQLLAAEGVKFKKYRLEGHAPPPTVPEIPPQMSGTVATMECTLRKEQLNFHAKNLLGSVVLCDALPSSPCTQEIVVQSSDVHYEGDLITLSGAVEVQSNLGKVTAEKAWLRRDEKKQSDISFPWAELQNNVYVKFSDGGQLHCSLIKLDHLKEVALFFGTPRVTYTDAHGTISAEEAEVEYIKNEKSLEPSKITLHGNVVLKKADCDQYALADRVQYFPAKKELLFHAEEGNRVLFFDKKREMQLSAPAIKALDNGEVVEGLGEVRFYFKNTELLKLKEQFEWEKK